MAFRRASLAARMRHHAPCFLQASRRPGSQRADRRGGAAPSVNATSIMLVVVVPVILVTLAFAWWYRSSNPRAGRSAELAYEGRLEFVIWSIPTLIVILLGGVIWIGSHQLDPRAPIPASADPLRVDVVALDWKWLFIYPDRGIAAVNQLTGPCLWSADRVSRHRRLMLDHRQSQHQSDANTCALVAIFVFRWRCGGRSGVDRRLRAGRECPD